MTEPDNGKEQWMPRKHRHQGKGVFHMQNLLGTQRTVRKREREYWGLGCLAHAAHIQPGVSSLYVQMNEITAGLRAHINQNLYLISLTKTQLHRSC